MAGKSNKNPYIEKSGFSFNPVSKISKKQAKEEIDRLRVAIEHHNYLYYIKNQPKISDDAFDKLFRQLVELEEKFPGYDSPVSPTKKLGASPVDELKKKKHQAPMLSLNAVREEQEVNEFINTIKKNTEQKNPGFMAEPKLDGLSVEIVYRDGNMDYGATRGDGETGEDISNNLKTIASLPLKLNKKNHTPPPAFLAVRGEVLMTKNGFQNLNKERVEKGDQPFANPRNAASGLTRNLNPKKVAGKPLDIFFYDLLTSDEEITDNQDELQKKIENWGLKINPLNKKIQGFDAIKKYHHELEKERDNLDYELDGIVIKLNDLNAGKKLGTRQRSPRWALAWKFEPKKEVTTLRNIIVQVGRTGILTPVALLDPVDVGGVTVSRASLHNLDKVKREKVAAGDKVRIIRAGDVIPEIKERVEKKKGKRKKFSMPSRCPVCNTEIVKEGAYHVCPAGLACRAQLEGHIIHYVSREAMNIENLGEKNVKQLIEKEKISTIADLYALTVDDLEALEGFAKKSAKKLYDSIHNQNSPTLTKFLYALGIRHVGEHIARVIAREFSTLEKVQQASYDDLVKIREIGPEIAESISDFFDSEENNKTIDAILDAGVKVQKQKSTGKKSDLAGKTFVITGELEKYTRSEAKQKIEDLGGRATSDVSSNTDYLVKGEGPGSKLEKAKNQNVKVIDEKEFLELLEKS